MSPERWTVDFWLDPACPLTRVTARWVATAVQVHHGHVALGRFHDALWTEPDGTHREEMGDLADALQRASLPVELANVGTSTDYDPALRASHADAVSRIDAEIGTPILAITTPEGGQHTIFGPVITAVPSDTDALRLWHGTLSVSSVPGFREIKA